MSGTGSAEMRSACLPICFRIMPQASTAPTASPSGRAWEQTAKRRPRARTSTTAWMSCRPPGCGLLSARRAAVLLTPELSSAGIGWPDAIDLSGIPLLPMNCCRTRAAIALALRAAVGRLQPCPSLPAQQLVDTRLHLFGAVDVKGELGDEAHAHALQQLMADVASRRHETFQRVGFFLSAAVHRHIDQRGFTARVQHHLAHIG